MKCKSLLALIPAAIISAADTNAKAIELPTLTCEDVFTISSHGTDFYACYSDVFTSPADLHHTRRFYETIYLISRVKLYGRRELGFQETANYREYRRGNIEELREDRSVLYSLYISPKFNISIGIEVEKHIPIAGEYREEITQSIRLYSHADDFSDEEAHYKAGGDDVFRRVLVNFNPGSARIPGCSITDFFMEDSLERQVEAEIHEDFHANRSDAWGHKLNRVVEEPAAAIAGLAGAIDFIEDDPEFTTDDFEKAVAAFDEWRWRVEFTNRYYEELSALYARDIPDNEKVMVKQEILAMARQERKEALNWDEEVNNATLMADLLYMRLFPNVYAVYEAHPDMGELVNILKDVPDDEEKAIEYLERFSVE